MVQESLARDSGLTRRAGPVPTGLPQDGRKVPASERIQGLRPALERSVTVLPGRQVREPVETEDLARTGRRHRTRYRRFELPHVPGPRGTLERTESGRGQPHARSVENRRETGHEVLGERVHIIRARTKGRDFDDRHRQPVVEVPPESSGAGGGLEVTVGGSDEADVHRAGARGPDPAHLPLLKQAQ